MRAILRLEKVIAAVVELEQSPEGPPSNLVHDLQKVILVIAKLNRQTTDLEVKVKTLQTILKIVYTYLNHPQSSDYGNTEIISIVALALLDKTKENTT